MPRGTAILAPTLGLVFNQAPIGVPDGALIGGRNTTIQGGKLSNLNLGWSRFGSWTLGANLRGTFTAEACTLIDQFFDRDGARTLLFGTPSYLFKWVSDSQVSFLNERYEVGTATATNGSATVTGSGTSWLANLKAGDLFHAGAAAQVSPTASWHTIQSVDSDTQLTLTDTFNDATQSGQPYTALVTFTGSLDTPWEAVPFLHEATADEDWWIATNGVDDVVYWEPSADQVVVLGLGFRAFHIAVFENMLLASDIVESGERLPAQLRNSDPGEPSNFTTGLASALTVHGGSDPVLHMEPLGDSLVLYSGSQAGRHIHVADFVGDPFIFVIRTAVEGNGPLSGRLVADFEDHHVFLGPDTAYTFDGVTVQEHGNQLWRQVLRQRAPALEGRAFHHFDEENGALLWVLPLTSDAGDTAELAWSEHYLEETRVRGWTPFLARDFPFTTSGYFERQSQLTWDQISDQWQDLNFRWNDIFFEAAFPFSLVGASDGKVYTYGTAQTQNGTLAVSYVQFGRRPLGDARMRGLLARVYPFATRFPGSALLVKTRMYDSAAGPIQFTDTQSLDLELAEGAYFVSPFRAGRFFELQFETTGTAWELAGYDLDVRPGGRR